MSEDMAKLPDGDPLMIAYKVWVASAGYANTLRWAQNIVISNIDSDGLLNIKHPHVEVSLWGAFMAGYRAADSAGPKP